MTSTGVPCTIVGTASDDVLVGTRSRDVICGRGGNDVIRAGLGDDLIDAGRGRDRVNASSGHDLILGGPGNDELVGDQGNDRIFGGDGDDVLFSDEFGHAADHAYGGGGDNVCVADKHDLTRRCRGDQQRPEALSARVIPGAVDVTSGAAVVTVRMHVTDDTGVVQVQLSLTDFENNGVSVRSEALFDPVSGTNRDGWWKATVTVPRYTPAGPLGVLVDMRDRVGRLGGGTFQATALEVGDANPDTEGPTVALNDVSPAAVDVRTRSRTVRVTVTATDALSGVDQLNICLSHPGTPTADLPHPPSVGAGCSSPATRTTGSAHDGVWVAKVKVPQGTASGTYDVEVYTQDRVGHFVGWLGPDSYAAYLAAGTCCLIVHQLPGDLARVDVTGAPAT